MGAEFNFGTLLMVVFILTSVCYLFLLVSIYMYDSRTKTRRDYMIAGTTLFCFSFFYGFMTIAEIQVSLRILWAIGFFAGCVFFPVWLIFINNLVTIKYRFINQLLKIVLLVTAVISILCIVFGGTTFRHTEFGSQFLYQNNLLFNILFVYIILLTGALLAMHIIWYRQSELKRNRKQVLMFIIISSAVLPFLLITEFIVPIYTDHTTIPVGSIMILPPSFFVFYSLRRYKLFGITVSNVSQYTFTSVKMPIYVLDYKNRIIIENNAAIDCLGENAAGRIITECFLVGGKPPDKSFFKDEFTGKTVHLKTSAGTRICDMSLTIEKDRNNDAICKIVVFTDMTAIKDMEEKSATALVEALEANKVKSEFLAKMSHEIRTPMNAIIGMTELVLREKTSITVREHTVTIKQASENLLSLINDLLDFSKIETGIIQIQSEQYSLSSLINDVVNITKVRMTYPGVQLIVDLNKDVPNILIGDVARIRQVLINVLSNAVKHTRQGKIVLSVNNEPLFKDTMDLILTIEDTGSGIKKEEINKLFTEYYQVRSTTDGVGLGLPITQGLVAAMNGVINVESEYGIGSKFTIRIPQKVGDPEQQAVFNASHEKINALYEHSEVSVFTAPEARVLVVDDISTNLRVVAGFLSPYKMTVDLCLSGAEAIELIKSNEYDLVFMDYRMPEMDGVEATGKIRALGASDPYYSTLPIIALTADAVTGRKEMLMENGFSDFISKPINKNELDSVLKKWIPKSKIHDPVTILPETVSEPEVIPITIDGLDIKKGIQLSGGKLDNYYEILASFHTDASTRLDLIKSIIDTEDFDYYMTVVHALKSATAYIGADEVSNLAASLENATQTKDLVFIKSKNNLFSAALEKLLENIKDALISHDKDSFSYITQDSFYGDPDMQKELSNLKSALENMDIVDTNNSVDTLLKLARTEDEKKAIRNISHYILLFEYDKANALIDKLYANLQSFL